MYSAKKQLVVVLMYLGSLSVCGQSNTENLHFIGVDLRLHPERMSLICQAGWPIHMHTNFTLSGGLLGIKRTTNQGIHKNESALGMGFGPGFRYYAGAYKTGIHIGIKADVNYMLYSWRTFQGQTGNSQLFQLVPMVEIGYLKPIKGNRAQVGISLLQGKEFVLGQNPDRILNNYVSMLQIEYIKIIPGYYHNRTPDR